MFMFEVHIPAGASGGADVTLQVEANNWMAALKTGLFKLGEQGSSVQNALVDICDDSSIHVTDALSGRVFRVRELAPEEAASTQAKRPSLPSRTLPEPVDPGSPLPMPAVLMPPTVARHPVNDPKGFIEIERPARPVKGHIGRPSVVRLEKEQIENLLADVFERVQNVYSMQNEQSALYYLLDLAMEKISVESGTVFRADGGTGDLTFVAVRGPKAADLLASRFVVPAGTGIVGFCATEGVSVAISDVEKDPRFYAALSQKLGYPMNSTLCSPMMTSGRTFGCMQLLNRKDSPLFTEYELGILAYVAHQTALYLNRTMS